MPAPLRGSTPRQFFILSLNYRYLCRSAQNDTEADCYTGDIILIRQSNFVTNGLYPAIRSTHCVISEQTPAAFRRTPKGCRQAESRHSRKAFQQIASSRKTSATAALCNNSPPPKPTKTSPKSTRPEQSKTNLRSARAGAFGGSSRRVGEVWRGRDASFKRRPSPSKVFLSSFLPTTYSKCNESAVRKACAPRRESVGISRFAPQPRQVTRIPSGVISAS